ncbi:MAG: 50S ribosomal protein L21e [Nanoarchaeota archaeon]
MVQRIGGNRRKTRNVYKRLPKDKGTIKISNFMQTFENGEKVCLKADSSYQKGMYFPRFHGKTGIVKTKKGWCYEIAIKDRKKDKTLIVHPVHLKRL